MTERERLVELLKNDSCQSPMLCDPNCKYANLERCYEERTADYLLENGVIVMPCSFGDTVYTISKCYYPPYFLNSNEFIVKHYISETTLRRSDIGFKNLYFTREEAEKALAEKDSE